MRNLKTFTLLVMINRILLRIKVIQILYAYYRGEDKTYRDVENELLFSLDKTYDLYHHLLNLAILITDYAEMRIEAGKTKFRPLPEELNPNTRFVDNLFVQQLRNNAELNAYLKSTKLSWVHYPDIIKELYEEIVSYDFFQEYMEETDNDLKSDKDLWRKIYKKVIASNENLDTAIEEQSIYWANDVEIILSFIDKTIRLFDLDLGSEQALLPKFQDDDESLEFAKALIRGAIENGHSYRELIDLHTQNWELDRIAFMDILIMEVAIAELMDFPTIPVNVTLNEYIEIAKNYSTDKSGVFINGVLDKIVNKLKEEKKLIKAVVTKR